jgi:hypothetical protein
MEVAWPGGTRTRWIARVGNRASELGSLADAEAAASVMVRTRDEGKPQDWLAELNRIAVAEIEATKASEAAWVNLSPPTA